MDPFLGQIIAHGVGDRVGYGFDHFHRGDLSFQGGTWRKRARP